MLFGHLRAHAQSALPLNQRSRPLSNATIVQLATTIPRIVFSLHRDTQCLVCELSKQEVAHTVSALQLSRLTSITLRRRRDIIEKLVAIYAKCVWPSGSLSWFIGAVEAKVQNRRVEPIISARQAAGRAKLPAAPLQAIVVLVVLVKRVRTYEGSRISRLASDWNSCH